MRDCGTSVEASTKSTSHPVGIRRRDLLAIGSTVAAGHLVGHSRVWSDETESDDATIDRFRPQPIEPPIVSRWRFGMRLSVGSAVEDVHATLPIPSDYREQKVEVVNQQVDGNIRLEVRELLDGLARQVVLEIDRATSNSDLTAVAEFEIRKHHLASPGTPDEMRIPKKLARELRPFLGSSPQIDTSNGLIKRATRDLTTRGYDTDWRLVEAIYDFVREKVSYTEGPIRSASAALKDGFGDCEDMTSLFVAMCRNARVPARMVWIPGHCYPEFCLESPDGEAIWYPCQAAGSRQFGEMQEDRPILQKGDKFKVAESRSPVRYLAETFRCEVRGKRDPVPHFVMEPIAIETGEPEADLAG